ncbi:MAG: amidohydrolase family protein [Acidimicrobiales bacterium]
MPAELSDRLTDLYVIDTDSHWTEPFDLWTSRAPARYADDVPRTRINAKGDPEFVFAGEPTFGAAFSYVRKDGSKTRMADIGLAMPMDEMHPASFDPIARLALMDEMGIYAQLIYPNVLGFLAPVLCQRVERDLAYAVVAIYNDACAEMQEESRGRLFPQAVLPFWNITDAIKEAERVKGLGLRGVTMPGSPDMGGLPDLGTPHWDPLFAVLSDLGLPINIHVGSANHDATEEWTQAWPSLPRREADSVNTVAPELANSRFITNLIMSDIVQRWPDLKWVSVESGIGWIPYVLERVDYSYREELPGVEPPDRLPALDQFRRNVYATFWFENTARFAIDYLGTDNVMWETDFPHPTCLYPSPVERTLDALEGLSEEAIRKVMQDNAADLYSIPLPATS